MVRPAVSSSLSNKGANLVIEQYHCVLLTLDRYLIVLCTMQFC